MWNPREEDGLRGREATRPGGTCITSVLIVVENVIGTNGSRYGWSSLYLHIAECPNHASSWRSISAY
jgi:hypothetical protein